MPRPTPDRWIGAALAIVGAVTAARLVLLAFDRTDLFVDEAQYWLWGQTLDWGYYSKPPLIAWVIRGVTDLAGSDAPYWVRMPGAVLHGVTALILAAIAARLWDGRAAVWVAAFYVTLPMVAVGSLLFSTDTVMLPCLAAALWFWIGAVGRGRLAHAALAGAFLGLAVLAKYAGLYGLIGFAMAAVMVPSWRVTWRLWAALAAAFALVIAPNVAWNLANDLTTLSHTADNAGWLREGVSLDPLALLRFLAEQFVVVGPGIALAFLWRLRSDLPVERALIAMALPPLVIVSGQALLGGANANWAVAGWLTGTLVGAAALASRPRLAIAALVVNAALAAALPVLTLIPAASIGEAPLLARYLGRADLSRQILGVAAAQGGLPVVASRRDVLADLFYTGRDSGAVIHALPPRGRPAHFYEQAHPLPAATTGPVLFVAPSPGACPASFQAPLRTARGAYAGSGLALWQVDAACLRRGG